MKMVCPCRNPVIGTNTPMLTSFGASSQADALAEERRLALGKLAGLPLAIAGGFAVSAIKLAALLALLYFGIKVAKGEIG